MKLLQERMWKKSIEGPVIDRFHKAMDVSDPEDDGQISESIDALEALLKEILRVDPEFEDTYNDIIDEIDMLGTPDSFEDTEDETAYEQWQDNYNYILSMMYDYCDANGIWIDPDKLIESKQLTEDANDGWDIETIEDVSGLMTTLESVSSLNYELNNTIRGAYSDAKTYKDLGLYIKKLANELESCGDSIMFIDENINEAYDFNKVKNAVDLFKNQITVPVDKEKEVMDFLQKKNISFIIDDHMDSNGKPTRLTFKLKYPKSK